uniref:Uncharacterized protein n=1 Tax=Arundo donax TaxID=35708 RepID=A0A0A9GAD9_ARUDO
MGLLNLHMRRATDCEATAPRRLRRAATRAGARRPCSPAPAAAAAPGVLDHGAQHVPEAVVAPPVADAAQHSVLVQRPHAGPRPVQVQAARHRRHRGGRAFAVVAAVTLRRRRRVLGHHGGRHGEALRRQVLRAQ